MVAAEGAGLGGKRPRVARRPEPHVDFVEPPLVGERAHGARETLAEAGVVVARREALSAVGHRIGLGRSAVDEDDVEVAVEGHLAAAQLAQAEHGKGRPRHLAVTPGEFLLYARQERGDHRVGDVRERTRQPVGRHVSTQDLHPHLELAFVLPAPYGIQRVPMVVHGGKHSVEIAHQLVPSRQTPVQIAADQPFEQVGAAAQVLGDAGRAAQDFGEPREQKGIVVEQQEGLDPGRQPGEKLVELAEGRVGLRGICQRAQQVRHKLGQKLPCARAAGGLDAAVMPASHGGRDGRRVDKAHASEAREGVWVVFGAGEHQVAALVAQSRLALEERGIVPFDGEQVSDERFCECGLVGKAHQAGNCGLALGIVGDAAGRLAGNQLQTLLDPSEEAVGLDELIHRRAVRAAGRGQCAQGVAGRART